MGILSDWQIGRDVKITPFDDGRLKPGVVSYGLTSYGYDARIGYRFKVFKPYPCSVIDPKNFDGRMLEDVDMTPGHRWVDQGGGNRWHCPKCHVHANSPGRAECDRAGCRWDDHAHILIPPHSFVLGETVEHFEIPRDVLAVCLGKSTYARCGVVVNCTPLEPEWRGHVTVEISNTTPLPVKVYCGEGIMQVMFFRADGPGEAVLDAARRLCGQAAQAVVGRAGGLAAFLADVERGLHYDLPRGPCRRSYADKKGRYQDQTGVTTPTVDVTPEEGPADEDD